MRLPRPQLRALSDAGRSELRETLNSEAFCDTAPATVYAPEGGVRAGAHSARRRGMLLGVGAMMPVLLALALVAGVGGSTPSSRSSHPVPRTAAQVVHVIVSNYSFHLTRVLVRPGADIDVTNEDPVAHTMTAVPGSVPFGGFNTGAVDSGQTGRIHAPKAAGTYDFCCAYHQFMRGVLVVTGVSRSPSAADLPWRLERSDTIGQNFDS